MRYRVDTYEVELDGTLIKVSFKVPKSIAEKFSDQNYDGDEQKDIEESVRLIVDESHGDGLILMSTGQKAVCETIEYDSTTEEATIAIDSTASPFASGEEKEAMEALISDLGEGVAVSFTIEMDWGTSAEDLKEAIDQIPTTTPSGWATPTDVTNAKKAIMGEATGVQGKSIKDVDDKIGDNNSGTTTPTTVVGWIMKVWNYLSGSLIDAITGSTSGSGGKSNLDVYNHIPSVPTDYAKQGGTSTATLSATQAAVTDGANTAIGMLKDQTNGLAAIKGAIPAIPTDYAKEGTTIKNLDTLKSEVVTALQGNDASAATLVAIKNLLESNTNGLAMLAKEANATSNKSEVISAIANTLDVSVLGNAIQSMAGIDIVPVAETTPATTSYSLDPNKLYIFQNRISDLTLELDPLSSDFQQEYHMLITIPSTATINVTIGYATGGPSSIAWAMGAEPDWQGGYIYEIGILNGLAVYTTYAI